jgi:hypothetical protein
MKVSAVVALIAVGGLIMTSCNLNPGFGNTNNSPILFVITSINSGNHLDSDVQDGEQTSPPATFVCPDSVPVRVENHLKNPGVTNVDFRGDIIIERYEVQYVRSDGRGVQGVDVPFTISGNLTAQVASGNSATVNIEVVRRQAKLEPPLLQLASPSGGSTIFTAFAQITLHGRTDIGQTVTATGTLQIDFADFGDKNTSCPTT